jgi:kynureninase
MNDPLLHHRSQFPILERTTYLISNSLGAMPASVAGSLASYAHAWATRGVRAWAEGWWTLQSEVGDVVGRLIGAGPGEVGMHLNVTSAAASFLSALDFERPRDGILVTDMNFPSLLYLYEQQQRRGMRVVRVESADGVRIDTQAMIDAIDERTRVVALDHVLFRSAYIQDAKAITEAAHRKGALVLLDAFQSVGTVPVDVRELGVDAAVGGALKWLCGGPGACWLWVRPDLARELRPALTGWMAHPDPFAFDVGPMRFRDDAFRFLNGTPNVPGLMAARPGLELVASIGAAAIRSKSMRQTARLIELASERGFRTTAPADPAERGGTVALDVPEGKAVCQELLARDVVVDYRPKAGVRVSPHFYTSDDELEHCVSQIDEILRTRAHEKHLAGLPKYG